MRPATSKFGWLLSIGALLPAGLALAAPPAQTEQEMALAAAARDVEMAGLRLRRYVKVEHPLKLRELETQRTLKRVEIEKLKALLAEYNQITHRTIPEPFIVTRQATELALLEAELRLANLDEEQLLLERYHSDQTRLYELDLEAAVARYRQLEAK
jgi:hypothetical protein